MCRYAFPISRNKAVDLHFLLTLQKSLNESFPVGAQSSAPIPAEPEQVFSLRPNRRRELGSTKNGTNGLYQTDIFMLYLLHD
jgi:hypothetical protein